MPKRKKTGAKKKKSAKYRKTAVVPGVTRKAGYYGRYNGTGDAELKFHDLDIDLTIATNGTIAQASCLTIVQGTSESERIGRKCVIRSINWRWDLLLPAATAKADTGDTCRIILYLDKQTNGAAAVVATAAGILESDNFQSFNNLSNKGRFRTLMDRTYSLSAQGGSGRGTTDTLAFCEYQTHDSFYKNVNIPIEYDSTTGAITEMRSNNIGVLCLGKTGKIIMGSKMRIRFEG